MRVLYVDDDRVNSLLFEETCRYAEGVEVQIADTGSEALALVARWTPDFLVIDLNLPDTNGLALLPALRQVLEAPDLPAFLCTADETSKVAEAAASAGFSGRWAKPVDMNEVLAELARRGAAGKAAAA
ncbi:MAG: response regulator [Rubrivivax sp.]|jgi:two-component system OmpR family response regulator|nr:response regulator [Rubrivivax sp.]